MMVQTEIGLLPEEWEVVQIGDIFSMPSNSIRTQNINPNEYVSTENLLPNKAGVSKYTSRIDYAFIREYKAGDSLMSNIRPYLKKIWFSDRNGGCSSDVIVFRPSKEVDSLYAYFVLSDDRIFRLAMETSIGTKMPRGDKSAIVTFPIALPKDKSEQQNIASALSSIDKLIDDLGRTIQKKQRIREGAMEELLSGKKRLPGFTEEWVEKKIGDIGKTYSGLTGKTKEDFGHGNAKYITFLNVLNNAILDITIFEAVDVRQNEKQNAAHYGDLFFNTSSETPEDVGTCACLNTEVPNLYLNSFCFGYRLNDEEVYGNFLAYFFRTKAGRDIMYSLAQGATRYNLSKEYFNEIKITMPPTIKEQQSISYVFEAMTDEISLLESERAKYEQIRSGMMEELLTGKKRLK